MVSMTAAWWTSVWVSIPAITSMGCGMAVELVLSCAGGRLARTGPAGGHDCDETGSVKLL